VGGKGGGGDRGEMTQTLYAHMNKKKRGRQREVWLHKVMREAAMGGMCFEDGGRGRSAGGL
jgi:hypothetical protein